MTLQTYDNVSGSNRLTGENGEFYQRAMLKALGERILFMNYGKKMPVPKNSGATVSWRRLELPAAVSSYITEGTTPAALDMSINKISTVVRQYGAWTKVSDYLDLVGLDPILTEISEMFGQHAAVSIDSIVATILTGGTNAYFTGNKTSRTQLVAGDVLKCEDIIRARNKMVKNNVPQLRLPNGKMGYIAFIHPDNVMRLMTETNSPWSTFNSGGSAEGLRQFQLGEAGQMYGIYFVESNALGVFSGGSGGALKGKHTLIMGADAFGIPDIAGSSKPEILVYSNGNTENPMALYKTVAWKICMAVVRLEEKSILRVESLDE